MFEWNLMPLFSIKCKVGLGGGPTAQPNAGLGGNYIPYTVHDNYNKNQKRYEQLYLHHLIESNRESKGPPLGQPKCYCLHSTSPPYSL
jgi:hypothetical protein